MESYRKIFLFVYYYNSDSSLCYWMKSIYLKSLKYFISKQKSLIKKYRLYFYGYTKYNLVRISTYIAKINIGKKNLIVRIK